MTKLYSLKEAAVQLGMSEYALRQGVRTGRFPFFRVTSGKGGRYLLSLEAVCSALAKEMEANRMEAADACRM